LLAFALLAGILFSQSAMGLPQKLGDLDEDGQPTVLDLVRLINYLNGAPSAAVPLDANPEAFRALADVNQDGFVNSSDVDALADTILGILPGIELPLTRIRESSPAHGEGSVAVTRETVFRFNYPLATNTFLGTNHVYATFGGRRLATRLDLSSDRRTVTLFYMEQLPGSARVRVTFDAFGLMDFLGRFVDLDGDGQTGGAAIVDFDTLSLTPLSNTGIKGYVYASEQIQGTNATDFLNRPLGGVKISVDGMADTLFTVTDANGYFQLAPCPGGEFFVHIDGRAVSNAAEGIRFPDLAYYPFVGKSWVAAAGRTNFIMGTNVYLPLVPPGTLRPVSQTSDTVITFAPSVLASNPALAGVQIMVPADSLFRADGARGGSVGIAPVPPDRLPGPLPTVVEGVPIVITVQTDGGQNFDKPVPVCFPNLPDPRTGQALPPGAKSALFSFNHDTGEWEVIGPMTVTDDGRFVCTDPGVGIRAPGWHCSGILGTIKCLWKKCSNSTACKCTLCVVNTASCILNPIVILKGLACFGAGFNCTRCITSLAGSGGAAPAFNLARAVARMNDLGAQELVLAKLQQMAPTIEEIRNIIRPFLVAGVALDAHATAEVESRVAILRGMFAEGDQRVFEEFLRELATGPSDSESFRSGIIDYRVFSSDGFVLRGQFLPGFERRLTLGARFLQNGASILFFDRDSFSLGEITVPPGGLEIGAIVPEDIQFSPIEDENEPDTDGDGLPDIIEAILGTQYSEPDTDGDGIPDGTEVRQGTNPVDALAVITGIIASADTPGTAVDVCAVNDLAIVADAAAGVVVFNVASGQNPVRIAQVDTPGNALAVSCAGNLIAVADGPAGLVVVDITDPPAARITQQLPAGTLGSGNAQAVAAFGSLAFVGTDAGWLALVDLPTGALLDRARIATRIDWSSKATCSTPTPATGWRRFPSRTDSRSLAARRRPAPAASTPRTGAGGCSSEAAWRGWCIRGA
jgi:hypothetical protein